MINLPEYHTSAQWLVVFAAQGIQSYILRSDKLREMAGASELVESLAHELLDDTLRGLGIADPDSVVLSRAAGAARIVFDKEPHARQFARLWPFLADRHAPGLPVSIVVKRAAGNLIEAIQQAEESIRLRRAQPLCELPAAGPFILRHARSGRPLEGDFSGDDGASDRETGRKRASSEEGRRRLLEKILDRKISVNEANKKWPLEMADIAGGSGGLGIFHADGNGLGESVRKFLGKISSLSEGEARGRYTSFCTGIDGAANAALRTAIQPVLARTPDGNPHPFRPLVCAGDDVTVILRDSDAFAFARTFLERMEHEVRTRLAADGLGNFTACGALVFVRPKFPFADAYTLCESMCGDAKKRVNRQSTALSFLRVASSLPGDYHDFIARERTVESGSRLTMNPYVAGPDGSLSHLATLHGLLQKLPRGALREVVASLYDSIPAANAAYGRFLHLLETRDEDAARSFKTTFARLTGNDVPSLWTRAMSPPSTPLYDALELLAVTQRD